MARFKLRDDTEFPALDARDITLDDVILLERLLGEHMDMWSSAQETKALLWFSLHAAGLAVITRGPDDREDILTWESVGKFRPPDVTRIPDDDDEEGGGPLPRPPEDDDPEDHGSTPSSSSTSTSGSG